MAKEITQRIIINFEDDGSFSSALAELSTLHDDNRLVPKGRREATLAELDALLPDKGSTASQAQALAAERDEALTDKAAAETERDEAIAAADTAIAQKAIAIQGSEEALTTKQAEFEETLATKQAEFEETLATKQAEFEEALATKQAEIDALQLELSPVDAEGHAVLTALQIRLVLLSVGVTDDVVLGMIAAIEDPEARETAKIYWANSTHYHRDNVLIQTLSPNLGLSEEEIDALWHYASTL